MPFRRRAAYGRRRPHHRRHHHGNYGLATRPRWMTRSHKMKRVNQVSTHTFWFKENGTLGSDLAGNIYKAWRTRDFFTLPLAQHNNLALLFDQYKILAMQIRFFPANVGIEPDSSFFVANALQRGATFVWSDQRHDGQVTIPTNLNQVINMGSGRMINSRRSYTRTIYRSKGYPGWAGIEATATADPWDASIEMFAEGLLPPTAGQTAPTVWYWTRAYKVLYRGRRQ